MFIALGTILHQLDTLDAVILFVCRVIARQTDTAGKNYISFIFHNSSFNLGI